MQKSQARAGNCAILGRPNVGKSTLLNALLGQKLAIATSKPQTSRTRLLGVYTQQKPPMQIAFVDTPGLHRPENALGRLLVEEAKSAVDTADVVVVLTDASTTDKDDEVLSTAFATGRPVILAINKVDTVKPKDKLLPLLEKWQSKREFAAIIPVSAVKRVGLEGLVAEIGKHLPEGKLYDDDFLTDRPERFFAAEFIREAIIDRTRQEVPHGIAVVIEKYEELPNLSRIFATILVERETHKGIVVGAKGSKLKEAGTAARLGLEEFLGHKVYLELFVKVAEDWTDDPVAARRILTESTS